MAVTQKNIADKLGISQPLVGMALRGKGRVSEDTRRQVLKLAAEMGYDGFSNGAARSMVAQRHGFRAQTGTVALLFQAPLSEGYDLRTMPFFMPFFAGLEAEARRRGREIAYFAYHQGELPRFVREGHADGAICLQTHGSVAGLRELDLPVVMLDDVSSQAISLLPDDADGVRRATRHLIENGHRRIAYLSWPLENITVQVAHDRFDGYRRALREAGLPFDESLVMEASPVQEKAAGADAIGVLLERQSEFTGLVCYNDMLAMGAVEELQKRGRNVPNDVSVVGFDDVSVAYNFSPALTSVAFDRAAMASRAMAILCEEESSAAFAPRREVFPVELAIRQTTRAL